MTSNVTCDDYKCEGGIDHSHVGVQPHLRRVVLRGRLVDGKTGEVVVEETVDNEEPTQ